MISAQQQETACLYVAGALTADEAEAFELGLSADSSLKQFTRRLQEVRSALAICLPPEAPRPELKAKVLSALAADWERDRQS